MMPFFIVPSTTETDVALDLWPALADKYGAGITLRLGLPKENAGPHFCDRPIDEVYPHGCGWHGAERPAPCPRCGLDAPSVPLDERAIPEGGRLLAGDPDPGPIARKLAEVAALEAQAAALKAEVAALERNAP